MGFKQGDPIKVITKGHRHEGKTGVVVRVHKDGTTYTVYLTWPAAEESQFNTLGVMTAAGIHDLEPYDVRREALIELAETMNTARAQAEALEENACKYKYALERDINQVLVEVLCEITGRFEVADVYDALEGGSTVREALAAAVK